MKISAHIISAFLLLGMGAAYAQSAGVNSTSGDLPVGAAGSAFMILGGTATDQGIINFVNSASPSATKPVTAWINTNNGSASFGSPVGIGTSSPVSPFEVWGGQIQVDNSAYGRVMFSQNGANLWSIGPRASQDYYIYRESGTANVLIPSGNLGIGLTNPLSVLHVHAGSNINLRIGTGVADASAALVQSLNDKQNGLVPLEFRASDTNFATGNVGIGTTSPQASLDVNGNVRVNGSTATNSTIDAANNLLNALTNCAKTGGGTLTVNAQGVISCGAIVDATTCAPSSQTQTIACPSGETGSDIQQQNYTCSGGVGTWGAWYDINNTCATPVQQGTTFGQYAQSTWYAGMNPTPTAVGGYYCASGCANPNSITGSCTCPTGTSPSFVSSSGSVGHEGCTFSTYVCN